MSEEEIMARMKKSLEELTSYADKSCKSSSRNRQKGIRSALNNIGNALGSVSNTRQAIKILSECKVLQEYVDDYVHEIRECLSKASCVEVNIFEAFSIESLYSLYRMPLLSEDIQVLDTWLKFYTLFYKYANPKIDAVTFVCLWNRASVDLDLFKSLDNCKFNCFTADSDSEAKIEFMDYGKLLTEVPKMVYNLYIHLK